MIFPKAGKNWVIKSGKKGERGQICCHPVANSSVFVLISTVAKVGCCFILGPLRRGHVMMLRGRPWACVCVCVRRMLSVHISTPLWTHGTGGRWPCGYPAAVRGLRGSGRSTSPSESLAAGWLGNILQCFLVSCFFFGGGQRWRECCVLTFAHWDTWKTFIYILL